MNRWSKDELRKIREAEELEIAPFREDRLTYRRPTPIWSVAVGDDLYVRSYVGSMLVAPARSTTLTIVPRSNGTEAPEKTT